jgi:hypothetical protein
MFAAPILIDRSMTNYLAAVSGNGNMIKPKMAAKYRGKRTPITTVQDQYPSYDIFPTHLIFHYSLPLSELNSHYSQQRAAKPYPASSNLKKALNSHHYLQRAVTPTWMGSTAL